MKFNRRERASMSRLHIPLRAALVALLVGVPFGNASGETLISKRISYFSIGGRTAAELDKALSASGPMMKSTGTRHPGATRIKFGGTVTYVSRDDRCAVGSAKVTLNTRIILPRWKYRRQAGRDLALVWDTLASDIKRHEERHAEIARIHARQMEKALLSLKAEDSCERMQARVAEVSAEEVERHDKDQARFDRTEAANFDRRMIRLLQYRLESLKKNAKTR
ncbi:DUF922 domain-containing protein [Sinorhizobium meliloti]|jgi:predicted secreted Zn-dependent protease|uniref:DUF922 domain-containing protein n=7 Tax=Sinorhizobium TaxID=28105 RepID=Q92KA0_RHIME|nr:hypothetical protein SM11_chr1586 [Sinorhizobium meliloti SM11]AGG74397.1 hypothetical protein,signal peptide [Sinorhizobium meliloti 2011]ARS71893.1 peptidase [Sinorhizobium meliloti RU11/001]ASJ59526.1 peptidase [Sinorhizobium meliloti]PII38649.1 peptidase [Sinorhizobium meliloti CCBAU 01290]PST25126.1 DUF922 domain-containing protein [Mesorhizobium loti]CAC46391.1 Hypothetical protein SMc00194 [Sinorhizobium meliloti 1021]